jgi:polar amino acid transport system substrate-binding protein
VFYLEERPEMDDGPFLIEERALLEAVCDRVGKILDRAWAEKEARQKDLQLLQLDKMAAVGTLVSGVAHEINNPNNFIMLNAPVLQDIFDDILPILDAYYRENGDFTMGGLPYTEIRENIAMLFSGILEGAKRIKNIVESLKSFARSDARNLMEPVDVNSVVKTALALVNNQICKTTTHFSVRYGKDLPLVKGNFQRLEQVVINLVQNACEALEDNRKAIVLTTSFDPMKRKVLVEVQDEGTGISAECLKKITDPFYTTRRHHGGTGLGLSVSSAIVKDHEGTLTFSSHPGKGTTARLRLPVKNSDPPVPEGEGT